MIKGWFPLKKAFKKLLKIELKIRTTPSLINHCRSCLWYREEPQITMSTDDLYFESVTKCFEKPLINNYTETFYYLKVVSNLKQLIQNVFNHLCS